MELYNEELRAQLVSTDEHFRSLDAEHAMCERRLEEIEAKEHLTLEDEEEEHRLKKQKLRVKDEMIAIISRHKAESVV